jgi:hypothetical protein
MLVVGFAVGASALTALAAWTGPNSTPPTCHQHAWIHMENPVITQAVSDR